MKKVLFLLLSLLTISLTAQKTLNPDGGLVLVSISGSNNVLLNETKTYTATVSSGSITSGTWTVANAQIISQNSTSATIKWTSNGSRSISYSGRNSLGQDTQGFYNVTVSAPGTPDAPPNPTVSISNCVGTIQRTGTPPSGVTWYWQGTIVGGISTANSSATYTATNTGTYYLRARDNSSGAWSTEASVYVNLSTGGTNWYADIDGDGLGDINNVKVQCTQPVGYVSNANDNCPNEAGFSEDNGCPTAKGLSDENYIFTTAYKKALTPSQLATATVNDKVESVQYYDGLGRIKQSISIRAGGKVTTKNNVPDDWTLNASTTSFYVKNGDLSENKIINGTTPGGSSDLLWECSNKDERYGSGYISPDGGWNTSYFTIDNTKTYRYSIWVKRTGSQDGTTYHGTQIVDNLDGGANGNPYFWSGDLPQLNQWYLLVGVVHPHTYRGSDTGVSGVYDTNGNKVLDGTEYRWRSDNTSTRLRNYLFYTENTSVRQYFWSPLFQEINGKEFSIKDLAERPTTVTTEEQIKDIVTHYEYDDLGRQSKKYLPYTNGTNDYSLRTGDVAIATQTYYSQKYADDFTGVTTLEDINAYSKTVFDGSPMNRILEVSAPGKSWKVDTTSDNDHTVKKGYAVNTATDAAHKVRWYKVSLSSTYVPTLTNPSPYYYPIGSLYKLITKDENWTPTSGKLHTTEEFKNKFGQTILKRRYAKVGSTITPHDTYYVYDVYNNLSFVIPPKVTTSSGVSTTELNELCYQYIYDKYNRLVEKKLPGKGIEYIVYDKLNRPILTQDAIQRAKSNQEWLFTKYDALGRKIYSGLYKKNGNRAAIQAEADANRYEYETKGSGIFSYTNRAYPTAISSTNTYLINYYDDYSFNTAGITKPSTVYGVATTNITKSLPTGSIERVLGTTHSITRLIAYDDYGQVIYTVNKNSYLGTTDTTNSKLDFTGKVIETSSSHVSNTTVNITDKFTYDHADRLVTHKQKVNSQAEELIVKNTYDELGTLKKKQVGNTETTPLQDVDYSYNVRGWLTSINDVDNIGTDLFTFKINYDKQEGAVQFDDQYNGNISQTIWRTANTDQTKRGYSYEYDALNRITRGIMRKGDPLNVYTRHHLRLVNYDKNGNITHLKRDNNVATMDDLTYDVSAEGNKLNKVTDAIGSYTDEGFVDGNKSGNDYSYDVNGNMTKDLNKGIDNITYNHLNLPTKVDFGGGKYISYFYSASGAKLKKVKVDGGTTTTNYAGAFIYENNTLKHFSTPEGYAEKDGSSFTYIYQYTDHLGNIRLNYANVGSRTAPNLQIRQENNYYPFGSKHKGYNDGISGIENDNKYNGQEYQDDEINGKALDWYDLNARNYDPTLGRFMNVDPLAANPKQIDKSPFAFAWNNPVKLSDPTGLQPELEEDDSKLNVTNNSNSVNNKNSINSGQVYIVKAKDGTTYVTTARVAKKLMARGAKHGGSVSIQSLNSSKGGENCCGNGFTEAMKFQQAMNPVKVQSEIQWSNAMDVGITGASMISGVSMGIGYNLTGIDDYVQALNNNKFIYKGDRVFSNKYYGGRWHTKLSIINAKINTQVVGTVGKYIDIAGKRFFMAQAAYEGYNFLSDPGYENGVQFGFSTFIGYASAYGGGLGFGAGMLYTGAYMYYYAGGGKERAERMSNNVKRYFKKGGTSSGAINTFSCFVKGTKVLMHDLSEKNIEDIIVGDRIMSVNINTMKIEPDLVIDIPNTNKKYKIIEAKFSNGVINKFSPAHPFWVKGKGWCVFDLEEAQKELTFKVKKLEINDTVLYFDKGKLKETKIYNMRDTGKYIEMYNLEYVKKNHTFFANGILVHNKLE